MAIGSPVSRLRQPGAEQTEVNHLAADTIDLYPIPNPDSVRSHQNEPTAEREDEILKDDGESRGRQAEDGWHLAWYSENDQQDEQEADQLRSQIQNCFQGLLLAWIVNRLLQR